MDEYTFIYCVIERIIWPLIAAWFLWYFREPVKKIILSMKKLKYKDLEIEFEEVSISQDGNINEVASYLTKSAHSFKWFRENTEIKYNDDEFNNLIKDNPNIFENAKVIRRDENGNRIIPGYPAIKLTKDAINNIENRK